MKNVILVLASILTIAVGIAGAHFYREEVRHRARDKALAAEFDAFIADMNMHPERLILLPDGGIAVTSNTGRKVALSRDTYHAFRRDTGLQDVRDLKFCQDQLQFSGVLIAKCAGILSDPVTREQISTTSQDAIHGSSREAQESCRDSGKLGSAMHQKCLTDALVERLWRVGHDEVLRRMAVSTPQAR